MKPKYTLMFTLITFVILTLVPNSFAQDASPEVVKASPLDTIPPPITDFFIPVDQISVEPIRNPGDFIGRIFAPKPEDWQTRSHVQPITGVTVTIASGPRSGESVATNPSGYYRFPNVEGDGLHLRVKKEHFEPKEVIVHRSRPTILANGDVPNYTEGPQQNPGDILVGQRWPDEVRFILEETLVVHDLLYVEGGRLPKGTDLGGYYSRGVVVLYSYQYADWQDEVGLLGTFAHEIAHAHQHATVSVDGSAWEVHGWQDTPEGRAYEEARRKDWEQVGKSPLDNTYGRSHNGGVALTETAAETCAHYWSVDRWGGRTAYGFLEVEAPHRYKWAEKWVPISIAVRPPPEVVTMPDANLASVIREELGLAAGDPITRLNMLQLSKLVAVGRNIKDLTGLESATSLRNLNLLDNQISDVSPLTALVNLKVLNLAQNPIKDREPLFELLEENPDVKIYLKAGGEPLPVTLSHFRAELTDAGVVLKWATESELDNAGFYIYRSETKDSEFKIVNPTLIQGAGTTSERHTYTWTDTTAKPNTVYYYRIEDVSHAGVRKSLATVRMRGLVSASGKLTVRWADLKAQD